MRTSPKFAFYTILKLAYPKGETEYRFHPTRKWRFDFAVPDKKIAFEYEGGVFDRGKGHLSCRVYSRNCEKYNAAAFLGWRVFRFTNPMVSQSNDLTRIIEGLQNE